MQTLKRIPFTVSEYVLQNLFRTYLKYPLIFGATTILNLYTWEPVFNIAGDKEPNIAIRTKIASAKNITILKYSSTY